MIKTNLLSDRKASFVIVLIVYVIAGLLGILFYNSFPGSVWLKLLLADILATVIVFVFSCIFHNASVYDPYWSVVPPVVLLYMAFQTELSAERVLLLIAVWYWGIRLTGNWVYTFHGLRHQDWRYTMLKESTGRFYPAVNFLGIHLFPTLVVYFCMLPAVYAFQLEVKANLLSVFFILVSLFAVTLQLIADRQMHQFRQKKTGGLIRTGLWKYSRHPNYLGEILMWWGMALSVISVLPQYYFLCAGALINTLMFLIVSIPMADRRNSSKPGFEAYKKETRMLLPIKKG